jgi:protein-tyrosine phosphatase
MNGDVSPAEFSITCLCTGNRFRSPLAEALLRSRLERWPVSVSSYGIVDLPSGPAFEEAVRLGAGFGVDLAAHRSRPLVGADLAEQDLVIGFELIHVATAVVDAGAQRDRAFTLPELAGYLRPAGADGSSVEAARDAVHQAAELRKQAPAIPQEIADPVGGSDRLHSDAAQQIASLAEVVSSCLFPDHRA